MYIDIFMVIKEEKGQTTVRLIHPELFHLFSGALILAERSTVLKTGILFLYKNYPTTHFNLVHEKDNLLWMNGWYNNEKKY